jgi:hypothetical protein
MLGFLMPADVRRSFKLPPEFVCVKENVPPHHLDGLALDHDVEPSLPFVATGHQDHVLVGPQVHGLLLA